ncbi:MAG: metal ABC transporter solute-binding protein, Zn/Mn family [Ilumatobacteraceae bacterium]
MILIPLPPRVRLTSSARRVAALVAAAVIGASCGGGEALPTTTSASAETVPAGDADEATETTGGGVTPSAATPAAPIATTTIWADITSAVLCGVAVPAIVPVGADPHTFEAPISARADIAAAGFVVANGLDLEEGLLDLLETVEADGTVVVRMAAHVEVLDHGDDHSDDHGDDQHDHAAGDPHIWLDPMRVHDAIDAIVDAAVTAGHDADAVAACADSYRAELTALDTEIAEMVAMVPTAARQLVTNHDALGYFADRYGFEVIGTVIPSTSTMASTNPADLADLAALIAATGVTTIFTDAESSDVDAAALAERLGGVTVTPLLTGSLTSGGEDGRDYLSMMRTNADRIVAGSSAGDS